MKKQEGKGVRKERTFHLTLESTIPSAPPLCLNWRNRTEQCLFRLIFSIVPTFGQSRIRNLEHNSGWLRLFVQKEIRFAGQSSDLSGISRDA